VLLVTIPGTSFKLDTGAQASLMRMVTAGMPLQITTAYRDREYQQRLRDLYLAGKGNYALPPGRSLHEQGLAVDFGWSSSAWLDFRAAPYGWFRPTGWNAPNVATPEWWHWEYQANKDTHKGDDDMTARDMWGYKNPENERDAWSRLRGIESRVADILDAVKGISTPAAPTIDVKALAAEIAKLTPAPTVNYAALAKAVNDDAHARMKS